MSVVPSTVSSLYELAGALLLVAEDALADTVGGTPDRSYVAPSPPAFDCCPFLSVYAPSLTEGPTLAGPGGLAPGQRTRVGNVPLASLVVAAVRCAPQMNGNGALPTVQSIEDSARQVQEDGWALWNALRHAVRAGTFKTLCSEVFFDGGTAIPEQGGCVGWLFTLRVGLNGIPAPSPIYMTLIPVGEDAVV